MVLNVIRPKPIRDGTHKGPLLHKELSAFFIGGVKQAASRKLDNKDLFAFNKRLFLFLRKAISKSHQLDSNNLLHPKHAEYGYKNDQHCTVDWTVSTRHA